MKKSTAKVLSFIGGMVLASVVIGVTISKSPTIRNEIEGQINSVLKTTKTMVESYKTAATKTKTAIDLIKGSSEEKQARDLVAEKREAEQISDQWDAIERQVG
ncbi:MAG: hypothetical protein FWD27_06820 [Coriobacteriia bacterium]|nr:hypothetical protein [Coriobacteriia bacterium]